MIAAGDKARPTRALILFAHGSREPGWAEPFERVLAKVREAAAVSEVRLAFLELMHPSLPEAVNELVGQHVAEIWVVPIFLGLGGHLQRDLPRMIEQLRSQHRGVRIECAKPAGEQESVLDSIAAYCAGQL